MSEYDIEQAAISVFEDIGYNHNSATRINRSRTSEVVLESRLRKSLQKLNPAVPNEVIGDAIVDIRSVQEANPKYGNKEFYRLLNDGASVEVEEEQYTVSLIDFEDPSNNHFEVVNQLPIKAGNSDPLRPDLLVYINGLPIAVFEFKDPGQDTLESAYTQVTDRYTNGIPQLFAYNQFVVVADSDTAKIGSFTASWKWFTPWRYLDEEGDEVPEDMPGQEGLIRGAFDKQRLLDLIGNFTLYYDAGVPNKVSPTYYQYYGVKEAVQRSLDVVPDADNQKIGVFWHSQGSGKSLSMVLYVQLLRKYSEVESPSYIIMTDTRDLDDQLYKTFKNHGIDCSQANSIRNLRTKLKRDAGGVIFTTVQKFQALEDEGELVHPVVNDRWNLIFVADEAHRSHSEMGELADNVRTALPNASRIGFTATPIHDGDRVTKEYFGDYVSTYKTDRAQQDGAVVPVDYLNRAPKLDINTDDVHRLYRHALNQTSEDLALDEVKRWTNLTTLLESVDDRLEVIAEDIVNHFNSRPIDGKGMIVAASREAAVNYQKLISQIENAPETYAVISSADDFYDNPIESETLKNWFKDEEHPFKLAVVCQKWTTGFDVPCLHTLYLDRPLDGHNVVQTIGRVNRVYKEKESGLVVDYVGIKDVIDDAFAEYTSDYTDSVAEWEPKAVLAEMDDARSELRSLFSEFVAEIDQWTSMKSQNRQRLFKKAENVVIQSDNTKSLFQEKFDSLHRAYLRLHPIDETMAINEEVAFYRAVDSRVAEDGGEGSGDGELIKKIMADSIAAEELNVLQEEDEMVFENTDTERIGDTPNVTVERAKKKVQKELDEAETTNIARFEDLEEKLLYVVEEYNQGRITAEDAVGQLKEQHEEIQSEEERAESLGLTMGELAIHDSVKAALNSDSEVDVVEMAKTIDTDVSNEVSVDWQNRPQARAAVRNVVKGGIRRYGVPQTERGPVEEKIMQQLEELH